MKTDDQSKAKTPCLVCRTPTITSDLQRGLCVSCYNQFRREKDKIAPEKREAFEDFLVEQGRLAADGRKAKNVFALAREQFENGETPESLEPNPVPLPSTAKKPAKPSVQQTDKRKAQ